LTPNEPVERACPTLVALGTPDSPLLETSAHDTSPKKKNSPEGPPEPDFEAEMQEKYLCEVRKGTTLKITGEGPMALVLGPARPEDPIVRAVDADTLEPVEGGGDGTPRQQALARFNNKRFSEEGEDLPPEGLISPEAEPAAEPTEPPTAGPAAEPIAEPTTEPISEPTPEPTAEPTAEPTSEPNVEPTTEAAEPTAEPTASMPDGAGVVQTPLQVAMSRGGNITPPRTRNRFGCGFSARKLPETR